MDKHDDETNEALPTTSTPGETGEATNAPATQEPASVTGAESGEPIDDPQPITGDTMAEAIAVTDDRLVLPVTRGRVVYYMPGVDDRSFYGSGPCVAHVVEAYNDRSVNLLVAHPLHGLFERRNNVLFRQPEDAVSDLSYAEWMPYQVSQGTRN